MAINDVECFDQFLVNLGDATNVAHDFGSGNANVIKMAIVDSTTAPLKTTPDPCWGAGGTTNFSTWEVTAVGDYTAGGNVLSSPIVTLTGNRAEFDFGDPTAWATGTDTDARWGIIYDDNALNKACIAWVDLGSAFDMSTGTLTITLGAPVFFIDQAP
jgi:hypothetical protein